MRNLFFIDSGNIFDLSSKMSRRQHCNSVLDIIYKYLPLKDIDPISNFTEFKQTLIGKINTCSIDQIGDLTLDLCQNYIKSPNIKPSPLIFNPLFQAKIELPNEQKAIVTQLAEAFQEDLFKPSIYLKELKQLMILDYCYRKSYSPIKKADLADLFKQKSLYSTQQSPDELIYCRDAKKIYDRLDIIYRSSNSAPRHTNQPDFLYPFSEGTVASKTAPPNAKIYLAIKSWYESEIFLGLIRSNSKKKNPFGLSNRTNKNGQPIKSNLKLFLNGFKGITISSDYKFSTLSKIDPKTIDELNLCDEKLQIYNQFILERLSCINFINKLYKLNSINSLPFDTLQSLKEFVLSPLLHFRLRVLDFHEKHYSTCLKPYPECLSIWNTFLQKTLMHQITCTLPILKLIFYSLMNLKLLSLDESSDDSFTEYFSMLAKSSHFKFYKYDKNFIPMPNLSEFPSNILDENYTKFNDTIYETLCFKTARLSQKADIFHRFQEISFEQEAFLIQRLSTID